MTERLGDDSIASPRLGAGRVPAVVLVDFARGWTDPASPMCVRCDEALEAAAHLVRVARAAGRPIAYTTVAYEPDELERVLMLRKTPRVRSMVVGSPWTEIDARVAPESSDIVLLKKHASAFFGTPLAALLAERAVDTLLIGGCITSGCVRATAVDAVQHGFRPLVVAEATADRFPDAAAESLGTIDSLYGDVVSLAEATRIIEATPG